jgi:hypothetical protein
VLLYISIWAGGMLETIGHLPSKFKALSSNPSTGREKKNHTTHIGVKVCFLQLIKTRVEKAGRITV